MHASLALFAVVSALTATGDVRDALDHEGVRWLATTGGLVRIEGERTRVITPRDGLPDGTVRSLCLVDDELWVGTDRGAARLEPRSGEVQQVVWTEGAVHAIERWDGALWLGTWRGLLRLVSDDQEPESVGGPARITSIRAAGRRLYVTTSGERAHTYDGRRWRQLRIDRLSWDIIVRGDQVWLATSTGVRLFVNGRRRGHPAVRASRTMPNNDLRALTFVGEQLVVGTYGGGLRAWDGERWAPLPEQPEASRRTNALALNAAGELLVATPEGLVEGAVNGWTHWAGAGLPDNDLSCLARTSEGIWIGTFRAGLALLRPDGSLETWDEERGLVDDRINRLAVDHEGDLWIATERGVMERHEGRFRMRGMLGHHVYVVGAVGEQIYASAGADLARWNGRDFELVEDHPGRRLQDLTASVDGGVLSGTAEGLAIRDGESWTLHHSGPNQLPDDWVTAVAAREEEIIIGTYNSGVAAVSADGVTTLRGDLWVNAGALFAAPELIAAGTLDQGLWLFDGEAWRTLTTADGLLDNDVTDVLPDGEGGLWVATRGGLSRLASNRSQ